MSWRIIWIEGSRRDLRKLDRTVAARVVQAVERLATEGAGQVKRLRGQETTWRLRVGDWRVRFRFHHATKTV